MSGDGDGLKLEDIILAKQVSYPMLAVCSTMEEVECEEVKLATKTKRANKMSGMRVPRPVDL